MVIPVVSLGGSHAFSQPVPPSYRSVDPIISTDWLAEHVNQPHLVMIDIRSSDEYATDHIPNAINVPWAVPFSAWITMRDDLLLELPEEADLFNTIGSSGITGDSLVVIINQVFDPAKPPPYPRAEATRVADTLIYAGINNVAVLDGGYPKWVAENKPTTSKVPIVNKLTYRDKVNKSTFISREYLQKRIGKSVIIDARDADVYFGITTESFAPKAGHIPSARSLPTPWIWKSDGTYEDIDVLREMAIGVVGKNKAKEIIVYCGVGGYASSWWFVLTQVLGYVNVKFYDGSAQEWVRYHDMVAYRWE